MPQKAGRRACLSSFAFFAVFLGLLCGFTLSGNIEFVSGVEHVTLKFVIGFSQLFDRDTASLGYLGKIVSTLHFDIYILGLFLSLSSSAVFLTASTRLLFGIGLLTVALLGRDRL